MPVLVRALLALTTLVLAACNDEGGGQAAATTYSVGGAVTGLTGSVTIASGSQQVTRTENGAFTLGNFNEGSAYNVTIASQPAGQTCTVYNGAGTANANVAIILVSCTVNPAAAEHAIGGAVSGLAGRLVLQNNLANTLAVTADGAFAFSGKLNDGGHYQVTVATQPFGQTCTVGNGSGTASADVTDITVSCVTARYTVGGTISGVTGGNATLQNNGGDDLVLAGDGTFTFATTVLHGSPYVVTVAGSPPGLECLVANGSGTAVANVRNVTVTCGLPRYTVGGTITGVDGQVVLQNNGGDDLELTGLTVSSSTAFVFETEIVDGSPYLVTVSTKPAGYECTVTNASGVANGDVNNVDIQCAPEQHTIGGTISGLTHGTLTLLNNGGDSKTFSGDGSFTFNTPLGYGSHYAVTLGSYPGSLACNVGNGTGTVSGDVTSVLVRCIDTAPAVPEPYFTGTSRPRELALAWPDVAGAESYQLWKSPDGIAPYTQVGGDVTDNLAGELVPVHRLEWGVPAYYVIACNQFGCSAPSTVLQTSTAMPEAVGYFKASNTMEGGDYGSAIALSADGTVMVIGADGDASDGVDPESEEFPQSGAAFVYMQALDGNWSQVALLKATTPEINAHFGATAAISADGSTIVIGAPDEADGRGAAYVYTQSAGHWVLQARLQATVADPGDGFGQALALSADGNTLATTASGEDGAGTGINEDAGNNLAENSGAAYVFVRNGGLWTQQAYVKASNTGAGDQFGGFGGSLPGNVALSADGNTLVVAAPYEDSATSGVNGVEQNENSKDAGAAYVFARNGDLWNQQAYLKASNTGTEDLFGAAVSLSADGNWLAIGAPREDSDASGIGGNQSSEDLADSGAAYLFERSGASWSQVAYVKASNTGSGDWFGARLAMAGNGTTLLVSAPLEDGTSAGVNGNQATNTAPESGAGYVFDFDGSTWTQSAYLKASNTATNDLLGFAMAISADGNMLAISARAEDSSARGINLSGGGSQFDNSAVDAGAVYLY